MSDWNDAIRISKTVNQIRTAFSETRPVKKWLQGKLVHIHDIRGRVDGLPGLGLVFATSMRMNFGVALQPGGSPFSHVLIAPNLVFDKLNEAVVESQSGMHHEVAHLLLHELPNSDYVGRIGKEYFRQPVEVDAYLHQALGGHLLSIERDLASKDSDMLDWTSEDVGNTFGETFEEFSGRIESLMVDKFREARTSEIRREVRSRLHRFRSEGMAFHGSIEERPAIHSSGGGFRPG